MNTGKQAQDVRRLWRIVKYARICAHTHVWSVHQITNFLASITIKHYCIFLIFYQKSLGLLGFEDLLRQGKASRLK